MLLSLPLTCVLTLTRCWVLLSAMTGAADYATFKNGWWDVNRTLKQMEATVNRGVPGPASPPGPAPSPAR